jgi:CBS domain-containing protein
MELARNLKVESVCRLRPTPPRIIAPDRPVTEAVALMRRHRVGCLLVCQGERLVGIFTERDLMRRVLAAGQSLAAPVGLFMTPDPVTVGPKEPINRALKLMEEGGYRHLPVRDSAGRAVGVLSVKRIVHYLAEHFPATIYNLPPDPTAFPLQAEGA